MIWAEQLLDPSGTRSGDFAMLRKLATIAAAALLSASLLLPSIADAQVLTPEQQTQLLQLASQRQAATSEAERAVIKQNMKALMKQALRARGITNEDEASAAMDELAQELVGLNVGSDIVADMSVAMVESAAEMANDGELPADAANAAGESVIVAAQNDEALVEAIYASAAEETEAGADPAVGEQVTGALAQAVTSPRVSDSNRATVAQAQQTAGGTTTETTETTEQGTTETAEDTGTTGTGTTTGGGGGGDVGGGSLALNLSVGDAGDGGDPAPVDSDPEQTGVVSPN